MFGFNLVPSSASQFSACQISSLSYQLVVWFTKIPVPWFTHRAVNQQVLCHVPSRRHQTALPCPSTSTSGICRMPGWRATDPHQLPARTQNPYLPHRAWEQTEQWGCLSVPKPSPSSTGVSTSFVWPRAGVPALCCKQRENPSCPCWLLQLHHLQQSSHTPLMPS